MNQQPRTLGDIRRAYDEACQGVVAAKMAVAALEAKRDQLCEELLDAWEDIDQMRA